MMDKRLTSRMREVRVEIASGGGQCGTDEVRDELCRKFPEYKRLKQPAFRRLISQELASPMPTAPTTPQSTSSAKKRKVGDDGAADAPEGQSPPPAGSPVSDGGDMSAMNGSIRKMYNSSAVAEAKAQLAKERMARAAARREQGVAGTPQGEGQNFAPEERPQDRLADLGGIDGILQDLTQLIVQPLAHPEVFAHLGVHPPTGVLLHGPPGSGKTKLAHAIAGTTGVSFFKVAATEIVSGMSGESEAKIRELFQAAIAAAPALLFLDEVDAITPKRDNAGREMERRIVAQILTCMDDLRNTNVVVMGATNRPDALDPALRRAGRFDREIAMGIPDEAARILILKTMTKDLRIAGDLDISSLAMQTPGFVGADLSALTKEAALSAIARAFEQMNAQRPAAEAVDYEGAKPYTAEEMNCLAIENDDFDKAMLRVQPSARREGFSTIPDVRWEDIGALQEVRADLDAAICEPIRKAALFRKLGLTIPVGVLLFGPPGCGKTLLAKAVANASGANFIAVKGPELLNKYVGESERAVRLVFQRAMTSSPCVIFFDELDALVPRRSSEGSSSSERVVNQMLTEMDGVQERSQVYVIAATNRPDIVDPAMLRPGRLDRLIYVPLPSEVGRTEILQAHARGLPLADDVDLGAIARSCDGFSGADLSSITREAAMSAIRKTDMPSLGGGPEAVAAAEIAVSQVCITAAMLETARLRATPSVGKKERREYESLALRMCGWKREEAASSCAPKDAATAGDGNGPESVAPVAKPA